MPQRPVKHLKFPATFAIFAAFARNLPCARQRIALALLPFILLCLASPSASADISFTLEPDDSVAAPIDITQPGDMTGITLGSPSGYDVHDSVFAGGDGISTPGSDDEIDDNHYYLFTIGPNGLTGPVAATYRGRLIPTGGGGGGGPPPPRRLHRPGHHRRI